MRWLGLCVLAAVCAGTAFAQAPTALPGRILFVKDGDLWVLDTSGPQQLATGGTFSHACWSPSGSQLAVTLFNEPGPTQIALVPLGATARASGQVLTELSGGALDPPWSPNGAWLAFAGRDGLGLDVYAVHPDGAAVTRLTAE